MANLDNEAVLRWKLDLGSFAALTREASLSSSFADLLRGMLADDPEHRPLPALLLDPGRARSRGVAARRARRGQRALMMNDIAVFDAHMLAFALLADEKKAIQFLRNGLVTQWLRRGLGDAGLAAQIEDLVRGRMADTKPGPQGDRLLVMHTISTINARMPLCWRGIALWPDALPALLAEGVAGNSDLLAVAEELLVNDIAGTWLATDAPRARPEPFDPFQHQHLLQGGGPAGLLRLFYGLNPLLPCRAPAMGAGWIATMQDLMRFLERAADGAADSLIDLHISAFIAARGERRIEMQVNGLAGIKDADSFRLGEIALLRDLQARYHPAPMPALAKWVAARLRPDLERLRNKTRREAMQAKLDVLVPAGIVSRLLSLTEDNATRTLDTAGAQRAARELAMIDAELAAIDTDDKPRTARAEGFGQTIAGGIGLSALILTILSVLLR
jgi:hypothetical protein